jgi:phage tail tape-measure protein
MNESLKSQKADTNPDPITGEPGSHPVGTGLGAAGAGATGAAMGGALGGPVGAVIGAAVGAVAGGYAGKGVAESIDPTAEDAYWRQAHLKASYADDDYSYDDYAPAYRTGYDGYARHRANRTSFTEAESDLAASYEKTKGASRLGWDKAKHATRAAWDRVERALPGDADKDGK